jgi:hypothetical protein
MRLGYNELCLCGDMAYQNEKYRDVSIVLILSF